jgi:hypothetical protein
MTCEALSAAMAAGQALGAAQQVAGLVFGRIEAGGDGVESLAELGRPHATTLALEEAHAVACFQRLDLRRQRRLAEPGGPRRAGKAAFEGDEMEGAELAGRHIEVIYI